MNQTCRIAMAQCVARVGDIDYNCEKIISLACQAKTLWSADIVIFPELFLTGYPPEDLLYRSAFLEKMSEALQKITREVNGIYCIVGHPRKTVQGLQNCASIIYNGSILGTYAKQHLPNTTVFDEKRYFIPGDTPCVITFKGIAMGIVICEDLWQRGPVEAVVSLGAQVVLSLNASPFSITKEEERCRIIGALARNTQVPIVYTNHVGAQDDLAFDGGSRVFDASGAICAQALFFEEHICIADFAWDSNNIIITTPHPPFTLSEEERVYKALVMGVRDYVNNHQFKGVLLGLSGGIDSALSATIAVDALGRDRVMGILLPSRFTSEESVNLALLQASLLRIAHRTIPIEPPFQAFLEVLSDSLRGTDTAITEQNLQARCRGTLLMALSNAWGYMVLTTSNRSELAVGYATLYGDMAGGFCALSDVPKTLVYRLAAYRNTQSQTIPQAIITREPSAELAPNQKDSDSLPPYDILDNILALYIDQEKSAEDIISLGFDRAVVERVIHLIRKNEYKRRQGALGVRLSNYAFGRGRRYPITHNSRL